MRFKNRGQKAQAAPRTLFFREFWALLSGTRLLRITKLALKNCQENHDYRNDHLTQPGSSYTTTRICLLVQCRAIASRPNYIQFIPVLRLDHGAIDCEQSLFYSGIRGRVLAASHFTLARSRPLTFVEFFFAFSGKREIGTARSRHVISDPFIQSLFPERTKQNRGKQKYFSGYKIS